MSHKPLKTVQFELLIAAASEPDHESTRISVHTHLRITESIESDMLSHDRHLSIKLWSVDHSSLGLRVYAGRVRSGHQVTHGERLGTRASVAA